MKKLMIVVLIGLWISGCSTSAIAIQKPMEKEDSKKEVLLNQQQSINQKLPKECGFGLLYYGKVRYVEASKTYYLNVEAKHYGGEFVLDQFASPEISGKYILLYGGQLVGGRGAVISGEVLQVVNNHQIDFDKVKVWCALQPNSSEEPKAPPFKTFTYVKR